MNEPMTEPMNEAMIVALAARRERMLDQPDLAEHLTAQNIWQAWTPLEDHLELPRAAEELIDAASADLGHFSPAGPQRRHAWDCAQAAAWGHARPLPRPPAVLRDNQPEVGGEDDLLRPIRGRQHTFRIGEGAVGARGHGRQGQHASHEDSLGGGAGHARRSLTAQARGERERVLPGGDTARPIAAPSQLSAGRSSHQTSASHSSAGSAKAIPGGATSA